MLKQKNSNIFRAFHSRNYTLFFFGQLISQIGTWMQRTGISWIVYTMTHSTFMLGVTVFAAQFPSFIFSIIGGIFSDRFNRHKILLFTQSASMVQAMLLAFLVLTHHYAIWQILTLSVVLGIINAFDTTARQPLVNDLIDNKAELPNALALNSSMVNLAMLAGPAFSGIVLVKFGAGICFLLNGLSFVAVLISLLIIKLPPTVKTTTPKNIKADLSEGFKYLTKTASIGMPILMLAIVSLLITPYNTLLPVFAKVIFHGNAATFGYMNGFIGFGAFCGALYLASLRQGTNIKKILIINTIIFGCCLALFSHMALFYPAMLFLCIGGFGLMSQTTICNTIVQMETVPAMRGRVLSYLVMAITGMVPLGSLIIGGISQKIGAPNTLLCQGILAVFIALIFSRLLKRTHGNQRVPIPDERLPEQTYE